MRGCWHAHALQCLMKAIPFHAVKAIPCRAMKAIPFHAMKAIPFRAMKAIPFHAVKAISFRSTLPPKGNLVSPYSGGLDQHVCTVEQNLNTRSYIFYSISYIDKLWNSILKFSTICPFWYFRYTVCWSFTMFNKAHHQDNIVKWIIYVSVNRKGISILLLFCWKINNRLVESLQSCNVPRDA